MRSTGKHDDDFPTAAEQGGEGSKILTFTRSERYQQTKKKGRALRTCDKQHTAMDKIEIRNPRVKSGLCSEGRNPSSASLKANGERSFPRVTCKKNKKCNLKWSKYVNFVFSSC